MPKDRDFKSILKNGKKNANSCFSVYILENSLKKPRIFTANISKKKLRKSSDRNLLKRRIRGIYHKSKHNFTGYDVLIMPRKGAAGLKTYAEIRDSIEQLLNELKKAAK